MFPTTSIKPDPDDQKVAMVTTQLGHSGGGGGGSSTVHGPTGSNPVGFISSSSSSLTSSSSGPHSASMMSLTPLRNSRSSAIAFDDDDYDQESTCIRNATPLGAFVS